MSDKSNDKKPSLIEIKSRHPCAITRGAITEIYVDGQRLRCVKKVELTIEAGKMAEVRMELIGEVRVDDGVVVELGAPVPKDQFTYILGRWTPAARPDPMPPSFGPWPSEEEIDAHYDKREGRWLAKTEYGDVVLGYFEGRHYESLRFVSDGYHSRSDCASWTFCPVDRDGNKVARTTK